MPHVLRAVVLQRLSHSLVVGRDVTVELTVVACLHLRLRDHVLDLLLSLLDVSSSDVLEGGFHRHGIQLVVGHLFKSLRKEMQPVMFLYPS